VHTFPASGTYYVCLAVSGPDCLNTTCTEINVGNAPNCVSYFTSSRSGLSLSLVGHLVSGLPATYNWSFGDGHVGTGQSIVHQYDTIGVFYVTLTTIDTNNCTYSSGQTLFIGDSAQFLQVYGQVFAGSFPLNEGIVALFSVDTVPPYIPFINISNVDSNGVYYFPMVPLGDFYLYAIPLTSADYLPTYWGDVLYWEDAPVIHLGVPANPYTINLAPATDMMEGNGTINGQINLTGLKSSAILGKIVVLLMNSDGKTISYFKVSDQGSFAFPSLAYGTYYLKAEIAGVKSDVVMVVLSPDKPQATVVMTFTGTRILGINEVLQPANTFKIYPNPVTDAANIAMHLSESAEISVRLVNLTGQQVFYLDKKMAAGNSVVTIPVSDLPPGMYTVCIISGNGKLYTAKLIR
jgi:PKD repeat protein